MARNNSSPVQQFRGTTAQHATYTGLPGELTVDTDKNVVVVHDGVTTGGVPMARADHVHPGQTIGTASGTVSGTTKLSDATNSTSDVNSGVAATPKAVKEAYDKAASALEAANNTATAVTNAGSTAKAQELVNRNRYYQYTPSGGTWFYMYIWSDGNLINADAGSAAGGTQVASQQLISSICVRIA